MFYGRTCQCGALMQLIDCEAKELRTGGVCTPVVGKAQLVAAAAGVNDPVLIEVEQVGVVVPVICLAPPVGLLLIHQLPSILAQQITLVSLLLQPGHSLHEHVPLLNMCRHRVLMYRH